MTRLATLCLPAAFLALASPAPAAEQEAIDGCIDQLRTVGGPDGQSGTVVSSEFSEAGTLVMLRDAGGTLWRCIGYSDGAVGELAVAEAADDGAGAMAGASGDMVSEEQVRFAAGTSGATLTGTLAAGASKRYLLGAKDGQFLDVNLSGTGGGLSYQIFNPDETFLLDMVPAGQDYRGQLWQSGDHVVEVINRGDGAAEYTLGVTIE
ncbi:hypothetical protein [Oceanomicrobium pacificus]|uniref:Secreted protein n=1 Tax=Oceanomicrobium pacificus TaxID=2692916 RepID=A0A6B0TN46_9RHOB|nr:hypothetical protein [Oceanomicrobium pacificus]MXU65957.1 hypothetical protein [Oceanomicrobium pacificus]